MGDCKKIKETDNISMNSLNRFLDDLFSICLGSTKMLHKLWQEMNKIHLSVKFTDLEKPEVVSVSL